MMHHPFIILQFFLSLIPTFIWNRLLPLLTGLAKFLLPHRHHIIEKNINRICPEHSDQSLKTLYEHSWDNIFSIINHTCKFPKNKSFYFSHTTFYNLDEIYESHSQGTGVILVTAHTGNFLLAAAVLSMHFPVAIVTRIGSNPFIYNGMHHFYRSLNLEPIDRVGGMFPIIRSLKKNKIVVFALDQHAGPNGVWVDFFGKPASTFTSPTLLARRLGCPVHTAFAGKWENDFLNVTMSKPLAMQKTSQLQDDLFANTQILSKEIESYIKDNPETWMALHNRWKSQHPKVFIEKEVISSINETNPTSV